MYITFLDETDRTESPCNKVVLLTERAELLLLECRDLIGRLEGCVEVLSEEVKKSVTGHECNYYKLV